MLILLFFVAAVCLVLLQRWVYMKFWSRKLRIRIKFESSAIEAGEPVIITERVENRKLLPLPVFSYEYVLARNFLVMTQTGGKRQRVKVKLALPARRAVRNQTRVDGLPRGVYALSDIELSANDLLGTFRGKKTIDLITKLTVYPEKIPASKLSLPFRSMLGAVLTRRLSLEDPFQLRGIRQYEIYDSMRDINWKASAKTGELKVNQHEYTTDEALILLLDLESGTEAQRESVLSLASSLSQLFLRRGVSVALQTNGRGCFSSSLVRVKAGGGIGHQKTIDECLAQIKLTASVIKPFAEFLREISEQDLARSLPVVISADQEGRTLEAFHTILGAQNGYYLSVDHQESRSIDQIRVFTWDTDLQEVRL